MSLQNTFPSPQDDPFEQAVKAQANDNLNDISSQPHVPRWQHIKTSEEIVDSKNTLRILESKLNSIRSGTRKPLANPANSSLHYESEDESDKDQDQDQDQDYYCSREPELDSQAEAEGVHLLWKSQYVQSEQINRGGSSALPNQEFHEQEQLLWSRAWQKRKSEQEYMPWIDRILGCFNCCK
ncbi:hypothetical protein PHYBLDRAFT_165441 [Phycomyces blakesleeanus NRRL 1555(-)]|uniref:Uncharacterized protein n=1 Tax=Phycomyces blakesleeanus (strain ATCC 8743b / DSM 1359 / FGSC 10004 / NBRC 33097 / NRRL 1555) TaxID=763407 RepID=A0A162PXQ5_PHYB8|nr:hypothetical protein PHYBLDRAFT_165441 [Phycomyces blakesleeanus NRRL 1555(-)]OAD76947.1 hypothetical protein PHYBLDRAFT_165441 [Phycomyces blakesleeanus NRRL 1555(-)]|eukprot:XP_018294987.1 hypothetical protein PHYBLDRAFT_165441 [Phycomyces blakesleeanus NRRL 1555(-)]